MNSEELCKLRHDIVSGNQVTACSTCYKEEVSIGSSMRTRINSTITEFDLVQAQEAFDNKGKISEFKPKTLRLFLDNKCNIRCKMCTPENSNRVSKNIRLLTSKSEAVKSVWAPWIEKVDSLTGKNINNIKADKDTISAIKSSLLNGELSDIDTLIYAGGEPLISNYFFDIIDFLIDHDLAKNITLSVSSNLSFNKYKDNSFADICVKFSKFKSTHIQISIDADETKSNYIRCGSQFDIIAKNLKYIRDYTNIDSQVAVTINVLNILYLVELYDRLIEMTNNFERIRVVFNLCHFPNYLSIDWLPQDFINLCRDKILKSEIDQLVKNKLLNIIPTTASYSEEMHKKFIDITTEMDLSRNQSIASTLPELYGLLF
jgi:organic radical activating enzyme